LPSSKSKDELVENSGQFDQNKLIDESKALPRNTNERCYKVLARTILWPKTVFTSYLLFCLKEIKEKRTNGNKFLFPQFLS